MKTDITIFGKNHTSLWLNYFLRQSDLKVINIIEEGTQQHPEISATFGGLTESITRPCQTFGEARGLELYQAACDNLLKFHETLMTNRVSGRLIDLWRLAFDAAEFKELMVAFDFYKRIGIHASLTQFGDLKAIKLARPACIYSAKELAAFLNLQITMTLNRQVFNLAIEDSGCIITTADQEIYSEIVVITDSLTLTSLFTPSLDIISIDKEQFSVVKSRKRITPAWLMIRHALAQAHYHGEKLWLVRGANYLRSSNKSVCWKPQIDLHLREKLFPWLRDSTLLYKGVLLKDTSCDELPIIGAWPSYERLLYAGCFPSNIALFSFMAGKLLSDIILDGRVTKSFSHFSPKRMQTI